MNMNKNKNKNSKNQSSVKRLPAKSGLRFLIRGCLHDEFHVRVWIEPLPDVEISHSKHSHQQGCLDGVRVHHVDSLRLKF